MKCVIQRVKSAEVSVGGERVGSCRRGLLVLLGVGKGDTEEAAAKMAGKVARLRIFEDEKGKMNRALPDIRGEALVVSNFTLCADCGSGNRPSFTGAEAPERAEVLYRLFASRLEEISCCKTEIGRFGADMEVSLVNDGPVTVILTDADLPKGNG